MHYKLLLSAAACVATVRAQGGGGGGDPPSLTDLIANTNDLSTLGAILQLYPNIADTLAGAEDITVFAPSNAAFAQLNATGALSQASEGDISALLSYHVVSGVVNSTAFSETPVYARTTLTNETFANVTGGQVVTGLVDDDNVIIESGLKLPSTVVTADQEFSGGIAHIIDSVLTIPLSVSQTAVTAELTALVGALTQADLVETVDGLSDVTIFAPIDAAFEAIGSAAGDLNTQQLAGILQYHVVNGTIAYASTLEAGGVPTLGGKNVTVSIDDDGAVFVNAARVILADVLVAGGVIHVIDSVLNPNNASATPSDNDDEPAVQFEGASSASLGPLTSGVPSPSTTVSALTETTDDVASGFVASDGGVVGSASGPEATGGSGGGSGGSGSSSSSSEGMAPMQTGMVGAAALFGGAALMANW